MTIRSGLAVCGLSLAIGIQFAAADNYNVINTSDSGPGSLRQAILDANAHPNINANTPDTISFAIPGSGLQTIIPLSTFPTITDPVVIDGFTQPGSSPNSLAVGDNSVHLIELNGNSAVCGALVITAGNSTVRGLVINRFNGNCGNTAILQQTLGGNTIQGCFLGLNATGTAASTNRDYGVRIESSPNNTIGGTTPAARNVIAGNNTQILINGNTSSGTTIQGNYIGTNAAGTAALSSGGVSQSVVGININTNISGNGPSDTTVGGTTPGARNVIAGNAAGNINFFGSTATGNVIQGNYIGINAAGTAAIDLNGPGIVLTYSSNFTIGGTVAGAGNVISGNSSGIAISGDANNMAANNLIQGNLIGTNAAGTAAVPNGSGISISEGQNNTIGGATASARNIISGNSNRGIGITTGYNTPVVTTNVVQGNFIGTDITGTAKLGNAGYGIVISGIFGATLTGVNTIGGATAGTGNIISGNGQDGIAIGSANNTLVQGNLIGTDINGMGNLGNAGIGISLSGANTNIVGLNAVGAGAGNVIAFNGSASTTFSGVVVDSGTGNSIRGNSIFSNNSLGIDLGRNGVTPNDPCDGDTGANNLQNFPIIKSVTNSAGSVNITGTLNSTANTTFRLEFFSNNAVDPTGFGEGQGFLGFANVTTDGNCSAMFNVNFPTAAIVRNVTATATDPTGNTSEFSAAIGQLLNISTRLKVDIGDNVLIGGFIITGTDAKKVIIRGIGPSLSGTVQGFLANPTLELHQGTTTPATNDNWKTRPDGSSQQGEIEATTIPPTNDLESALVATLPANGAGYTAIVRGKDNTTGIGVVEAYDLDQAANSRLANISTRGFVETGNNVLIGGFIAGNGLTKVIVRAIGPTLINAGVTNPLQDPTLELHDGNGLTIRSNDNWKVREDGNSQQAEIEATTIPPTNDFESALVQTLPPGNYTAVVRGANGTTGTAVVEVYNLPP
ncbi:MAG: hypothetical protein QOD12_192 [Verrucomicrobiota bacterium]